MIELLSLFLEFCFNSDFMIYSFACLLVLGMFNAIRSLQ